jgi:hypothetical protein
MLYQLANVPATGWPVAGNRNDPLPQAGGAVMTNHPITRRLAVLVLLISTAVISRDITAEHFRHTCPTNQTRPTATLAQ